MVTMTLYARQQKRHRSKEQTFGVGLPFPSPGDLPDLGIEPGSPAL